jgi:FeS assembly protein IscX
MPEELDWTDFEEIGQRLYEEMPDVDPLTVRFTDLKQYVFDLNGFVGDRKAVNERKLEAIQMAWHELFEDADD